LVFYFIFHHIILGKNWQNFGRNNDLILVTYDTTQRSINVTGPKGPR